VAAGYSGEAAVTVTRNNFAGVLNILQYNWHFYAVSLCALLGAGALLRFRGLPRVGEGVVILAAAVTAFWFVSSLLVSYYVYDYKGVTAWEWMPSILSFRPQQWLNIHAGLDESTLLLTQLFPNTQFAVVDIFDPEEMTEPSIARARRLHPTLVPAITGKLDALPFADRSYDTLFLLFAAHEIRQPTRRMEFFRECVRILANPGQFVLVEHVRDWKNFVAFGPGFLHFHSRDEWIRLAHDAGLTIEREDHVTPFVRCFLMIKADE
jgi:SAM-dependent methyltransferase